MEGFSYKMGIFTKNGFGTWKSSHGEGPASTARFPGGQVIQVNKKQK